MTLPKHLSHINLSQANESLYLVEEETGGGIFYTSHINPSCRYDHHEDESVVSEERSLWRAVVLQAVLDCLQNNKRTENMVAKNHAINWFSMRNKDFVEVCEKAQLDPRMICNDAQRIIETYVKGKEKTVTIMQVLAEERKGKQ